MASIIRWLSRVASRLCCGSKCTGKNDSEEVLNEGGSLSSEKEQPSGIGKISHDETGELQVKIEEDAHVIEEGVGTSCRDDTATCDDPSTVCEGNATRNLDPTTVCSTAAVNEKTVEDSPLQTMEILPQLEICHPSKNWSENKISEQAPNGSDAYVCIEGREFCVHSDIIRQKSTFFQQKLEGREGLQTVIFLPSECLSSESFELLLEFMYRGDLRQMEWHKIEAVRRAVRYLGMKAAEEHCKQVISRTNKFRRQFDILTRSFREVVPGKEFLLLNKRQVIEVLEMHNTGAGSAMLVFAAALKWLHYDIESREGDAFGVVGCVRFGEMSEDEISACRHPPIMRHIMEREDTRKMLIHGVAPSAGESIKYDMCQKLTPRISLEKKKAIKLWN